MHATTWEDQSGPVGPVVGHLAKRGDRKLLISTEFGQVSSAKVSDGNETFLLHFITLEPNSLFLPVMLRQDMVSYVHTGINFDEIVTGPSLHIPIFPQNPEFINTAHSPECF